MRPFFYVLCRSVGATLTARHCRALRVAVPRFGVFRDIGKNVAALAGRFRPLIARHGLRGCVMAVSRACRFVA